jgi:hypothetical protein
LRTLVSAAAVVIALVLAAVAVPALWVDSNIVREDGFIALAAPLGEDEVFQERLSSAAVAALASEADLPAPLEATGAQLIAGAAQTLSTQPEYPAAWEETLRKSHRLNFPAAQASDPEAPTSLTLDLSPLVALLADQVATPLGISFSAPNQVLFDVGTPEQRQRLEQVSAYSPLAWILLLGAAIALGLSLVAARRRSVVVLWVGFGLLGIAGLWHLGVAATADFAINQASGNPVAELFKQEFLASAQADFSGWIMMTLIVAAALVVAGMTGAAVGSARRRASARRGSVVDPGSM